MLRACEPEKSQRRDPIGRPKRVRLPRCCCHCQAYNFHRRRAIALRSRAPFSTINFPRFLFSSTRETLTCMSCLLRPWRRRLVPLPLRLTAPLLGGSVTADQLTGLQCARTSPLPLVHRVHSLSAFRAPHIMPKRLS